LRAIEISPKSVTTEGTEFTEERLDDAWSTGREEIPVWARDIRRHTRERQVPRRNLPLLLLRPMTAHRFPEPTQSAFFP
jgi:hypothetical protein